VQTESDDTRYYSVDLNLSEAFRFRVPTTESLGELREVLARLPVRRFRGGGATRDTLANTTSCGSLDEVMTRLTAPSLRTIRPTSQRSVSSASSRLPRSSRTCNPTLFM
jgi:hypothetical protein